MQEAPQSGLSIPWHAENAVCTLEEEGAFAFKLCEDRIVRKLAKEARGYVYAKEKDYVGKHHVRQDLSAFRAFPPESPFLRLRDTIASLLNAEFATLCRYPFSTPLHLDDLVLQRYPKGSSGISPHKDGLSMGNLVCVLVLAGTGDFTLCDDREGSNPRVIQAPPGHMILMRAPGFLGKNEQPFHFLANITKERCTFGLRQRIRAEQHSA